MKILATADIHISDWLLFSEIDKSGVPSRLKAYETLANDVMEYAVKHDVKVIILAGDICQSPILRPMVLNYGRRFLRILSSEENIHVLAIPGQHDADTKSQVDNAIHSVVSSIIPRKHNFHYFSRPNRIHLGQLDFLCAPWSRDGYNLDLLAADVFVGHGMVSGATDIFGYVFNGGFDSKLLLKRFILSVIGDTHHAQTFKSKRLGHAVVLPGNLVQNKYGDDPNAGFWLAEVENGSVELHHESIYNLRDDGSYHRFLILDNNDDIPDKPNVHVRLETKTLDKGSNLDEVQETDPGNLPKIIERVLNEQDPENKKLCWKLITLALESIEDVELKVPKPITLEAIEGHNFCSIQDFELDFRKVKDDLLIVGANGEGKSNLVELICYALTGETAKQLKVDEIPNAYLGEDFSTSITFSLKNKVRYVINRGRKDSKPFLGIEKIDHDHHSPTIDKGSTRQTQEYLHGLLGLDSNDFRTLVYFPGDSDKLFGSFKASAKQDLLGRFVGIDRLEALRGSITKLEEKYRSKLGPLEGQLTEIQANISSLNGEISSIREEAKGLSLDSLTNQIRLFLSVDDTHDLDNIRKLLYSQRKDYQSKLDTLNKKHELKRELWHKIRLRESQLQLVLQPLEEVKAKLVELNHNFEQVEEKRCPTCKQVLFDSEQLREHIKTEIDTFLVKKRKYVHKKDRSKHKLSKLLKAQEAIPNVAKQIQDCSDNIELINGYLEKIDSLTSSEQHQSGVLVKSLEQKLKLNQYRLQEVKAKYDRSNLLSRTAAYLKNKLLARNGPVVIELTRYAATLLEREMNALVSEYKLVKFKVEHGKDIEILAKFYEEDYNPKLVKTFNFRQLSSAQKRLTELTTIVALNNLFSKMWGLINGFIGGIIIDEIFVFFGAKFTDTAYGVLSKSVAKYRIVISHDERLASYFGQRIEVKLNEGISEYRKVGFE